MQLYEAISTRVGNGDNRRTCHLSSAWLSGGLAGRLARRLSRSRVMRTLKTGDGFAGQPSPRLIAGDDCEHLQASFRDGAGALVAGKVGGDVSGDGYHETLSLVGLDHADNP